VGDALSVALAVFQRDDVFVGSLLPHLGACETLRNLLISCFTVILLMLFVEQNSIGERAERLHAVVTILVEARCVRLVNSAEAFGVGAFTIRAESMKGLASRTLHVIAAFRFE